MSTRSTFRHALRPFAAALGVGALILAATPAGATTVQPQLVPGTWGTNGRVAEILPVGNGSTVVAGAFTAVTDAAGVSHPAGNLALLDATGAAVTPWLATTDGEVDALAVQGNTLYIGGTFTKVDGASHGRLAALDLGSGALLPGFTATANGKVYSLAATPTAVFAGGQFTSVKTKSQGTIAYPYVAKLDPATGAVDPNWLVRPNDKVRSVLVSPDFATVYLGGDFGYLGFSSAPYAAALTTASPAVRRPYQVTSDGPILKQAYDNGNVYLAVGGPDGACVSVNATTGSTNWWVWTDGDVQAVTAYGGIAYCGGHFDYAGGSIVRRHLVAVSLTYPYSITAWNPGANSVLGVFALANDGTTLFAGGDFTKTGYSPRAHFAEFATVP